MGIDPIGSRCSKSGRLLSIVRRESAGRGGWPIDARRVSSNGRLRLGLRAEAVVECLDEPVALARGLLQLGAVNDPDDAPPEGDEAGLLQRAGGDRDRLAAHAQ